VLLYCPALLLQAGSSLALTLRLHPQRVAECCKGGNLFFFHLERRHCLCLRPTRLGSRTVRRCRSHVRSLGRLPLRGSLPPCFVSLCKELGLTGCGHTELVS